MTGFHMSVYKLSHREWPSGLSEINNIILSGFGDGGKGRFIARCLETFREGCCGPEMQGMLRPIGGAGEHDSTQ